MDVFTLNEFENIFMGLRASIVSEMKVEDLSQEKGDEVDLTQDERQRNIQLKLLSRQKFMLRKIDNALFKIKSGTYGICEECEKDIEINRLRARPVAELCIACKEESERKESHTLYENRSHTHGRSFNNNVVQLRSDNVFVLESAINK